MTIAYSRYCSQFYRSNKSNYEYGSIEKVVYGTYKTNFDSNNINVNIIFRHVSMYELFVYDLNIVLPISCIATASGTRKSQPIFRWQKRLPEERKNKIYANRFMLKKSTLSTIDLNFKLILTLWNHTMTIHYWIYWIL